MESLSLTEASVLTNFLNDPSGKQAITSFFEEQRVYFSDRCIELMLANDVENARRMACFSTCYEGIMRVLAHYASEQLRRAA